ncbi:hypothetical protein D9757_015382 [Collybiopsis confluens]|uniref:HAT C-terminal dimerisation domain-containing protein n=1 Tax=Collybiopsis confluens TaxID=2823264 RepID=A0A8H5C9Z9_9AGAR|nr:hypothetical protein D9757_015382 [Collybiopsis confluens]
MISQPTLMAPKSSSSSKKARKAPTKKPEKTRGKITSKKRQRLASDVEGSESDEPQSRRKKKKARANRPKDIVDIVSESSNEDAPSRHQRLHLSQKSPVTGTQSNEGKGESDDNDVDDAKQSDKDDEATVAVGATALDEDNWIDLRDPPAFEEQGEPAKKTLEWYQWTLHDRCRRYPATAKLVRGWKAEVYEHFSKVRVEYNPQKKQWAKRWPVQNAHTAAHAKYDPDNRKGPKQSKITDNLPPKFHKGKFRLKVLSWITARHRPDSIVEDPELKQIFVYLNPQAITHSRRTHRRDIKTAFLMTRDEVRKLLHEYEGCFNTIYDCWTAGNGHEFMALDVSFVRSREMFVVTLDLIEMKASHTGKYLADRAFQCLSDFGIADRTLGHTGDNASNNNKMLDHLTSLYDQFPLSIAGRDMQIRCFGHILNLIYHALCSQFEPRKSDKTTMVASEGAIPALDDLNDNDNPDDDVDAFQSDIEDDALDDDEAEWEEVAARILAKEDDELAAALAEASRFPLPDITPAEERLGRAAVQKIIRLGHRCANRSLFQKELVRLCILHKMDPLKMVKRVATRWNTMYTVIKRALKLKNPLNALCDLSEFNKDRRPTQRLKRLLLTGEEWAFLEQLLPILKLLYDATNRVSKSNWPMLHEVIPTMELLNRKLEEYIGVQQALLVLDKYYAKTDESIMWKTAMFFHPKYRKHHFTKEGWKEEWIDAAARAARKTWNRHYKPLIRQSNSQHKSSKPISNVFSALDAPAVQADRDPFEDFINGDVTNDEPLDYWSQLTAKKGSATVTPVQALACMALDFLSAPATSTDVERLFSHAGLVVSKHRYNLTPDSIRQSVVLGNWLACGVVPYAEIARTLKKKYGKKSFKVPGSDSEWSDSDSGMELTQYLPPGSHLDLFVVGTSICHLRLSLRFAALLRHLALLLRHTVAPHPCSITSDLFVTVGKN